MWVKADGVGPGTSMRLIDLSQVERATRSAAGSVVLYYKSGSSEEYSGVTAVALWKALEHRVKPATWKKARR